MTEKNQAPQPQTIVEHAPIDSKLLEQMIADGLAKDQKRRDHDAMLEIEIGPHGLHAKNMLGLWKLAQMYARSGWAPLVKMHGEKRPMSAEAIFVSMAKGAELGLGYFESVQSFVVVDNRPTLATKAMLAVCQRSGALEDYQFEWHGQPFDDDFGCTVRIKRKGIPTPSEHTWTVADAKKAELWNKDNWKKYPRRMLQWRPTSWACQDLFSDKLHGMISTEEALDIGPDDSPDGAPLPDVDPKANPTDQLAQMFGGRPQNGGAPAPPAPEPSEPEPAEETEPEALAEPEGESAPAPTGPPAQKCTMPQATRLTKLCAQIFPEVEKGDVPAHLCGLGWSWNKGPLPPVEKLSELTDYQASEMINELEVMLRDMQEAER